MKKRITRKSRKTRKQRGGFIPSIYGGVQGAGMLIPLAVRQGYRLWSNRKPGRHTRKARRTQKK